MMGVLNMMLNNLMMKLHSWSFGTFCPKVFEPVSCDEKQLKYEKKLKIND